MPRATAGCSITRSTARLAVVSPSTRTRPLTGTPPRTVSEIPFDVRAAHLDSGSRREIFPGRFTWAIRKYDPGATPRNSKIPVGSPEHRA